MEYHPRNELIRLAKMKEGKPELAFFFRAYSLLCIATRHNRILIRSERVAHAEVQCIHVLTSNTSACFDREVRRRAVTQCTKARVQQCALGQAVVGADHVQAGTTDALIDVGVIGCRNQQQCWRDLIIDTAPVHVVARTVSRVDRRTNIFEASKQLELVNRVGTAQDQIFRVRVQAGVLTSGAALYRP